MDKSHITYSLWALFTRDDERFLRKIKKLANSYLSTIESINISDFPIHMTINSNINKNSKNLKQNIKKIKPFEIQADSYLYKKKFFQSFFVRVKVKKKLIDIKNTLEEQQKFKNKYFLPHVSLSYGDQKSKTKKKSIKALPKIKNKVFKINRLCIAKNDEKNFKWKIIKIFKI